MVEKVDPASLGTHDRYHGVHGYGPTQPDYYTTAMFYGPDIKEDGQVDSAHLVDEAPTFARLLNLHYPHMKRRWLNCFTWTGIILTFGLALVPALW